MNQDYPALNGATEPTQMLAGPDESQAHIPQGVADYFWGEAYARRRLETDILELFRTWGYQDVITPTFEHAATFETGTRGKLRAKTYRFLDRDGTTLALRPDMTIPVARLVGVRLHDIPMPQRFCYAGAVFRYTAPQAGIQREFLQTGVELIGAQSPAADAEVIALAGAAVKTAGIREHRLVLGQIAYFDALLRDLQLTPEQTAQLLRAVDRNSQADLNDFLRDTPLRTQQRRTIEEIPHLSGPNASAILDRAERLCLNYDMHQAVANLRAIVVALDAYGIFDYVYLDMSEINNLGYYTGVSFEILVPGLGFPIGSGGRYDRLIGAFGKGQPAVGVALGIDRMLIARRLGDSAPPGLHDPRPLLYVVAGNNPDCLRLVQDWRQSGLRVMVELDDLTTERAWEAAKAQGANLALIWSNDGFQLRTLDDTAGQEPKWIAADQIVHHLPVGGAATSTAAA